MTSLQTTQRPKRPRPIFGGCYTVKHRSQLETYCRDAMDIAQSDDTKQIFVSKSTTLFCIVSLSTLVSFSNAHCRFLSLWTWKLWVNVYLPFWGVCWMVTKLASLVWRISAWCIASRHAWRRCIPHQMLCAKSRRTCNNVEFDRV